MPALMTKIPSWPLVKVIDLKTGSDGVVRTVKLHTESDQTLWTPVNGLIPITSCWGEKTVARQNGTLRNQFTVKLERQ